MRRSAMRPIPGTATISSPSRRRTVPLPSAVRTNFSGTVESLGVLLRLEADGAGTGRPVDSCLLDPCQTARSEQAVGDGIQIPYVVVSEPQNTVISIVAAIEHLGPTQVGKGEFEVEGGVDHQYLDGLLRSTETVLGLEAHRQILARLGSANSVRF